MRRDLGHETSRVVYLGNLIAYTPVIRTQTLDLVPVDPDQIKVQGMAEWSSTNLNQRNRAIGRLDQVLGTHPAVSKFLLPSSDSDFQDELLPVSFLITKFSEFDPRFSPTLRLRLRASSSNRPSRRLRLMRVKCSPPDNNETYTKWRRKLRTFAPKFTGLIRRKEAARAVLQRFRTSAHLLARFSFLPSLVRADDEKGNNAGIKQ